MRPVRQMLALIIVLSSIAGCGGESESSQELAGEAAQTAPSEDEIPMLRWAALTPPDWRPAQILQQYDARGLRDEDPRAQELMAKLQAVWREAPVVPELDGRHVKMLGYVVPLETDGERISQFLLVPFVGACIHAPPPPANQTILVVTAKGHEYRGRLSSLVWVEGIIRVKATTSDLATAGYELSPAQVTPFAKSRKR